MNVLKKNRYYLSAIIAIFCGFTCSSQSALAAEFDPGQTVSFPTPNGADAPVEDCGGSGNLCAADTDPSDGKMWLYSTITLGGDQDIFIQQNLWGEFTVSPDDGKERVLDSIVSGSVDYYVHLTVALDISARAEFRLVAALFDVTSNQRVASQQIDSGECKTIPLIQPTCLDSVDGPRSFSFPAKLVRGHTYQVQLIARCESHNSAGVDVQCAAANLFRPPGGQPLPAPDGFILWKGFEVAIGDDIAGQIDELMLLVEELQASLDDHDDHLSQHDEDMKALLAALEGKVDDNNNAILESIRLLLTPQGRRESDLVDCNDEPGCDFPTGKDK